MKFLFRALNADRDDELTCQECRDRLPEYLHAEEEGQAHAKQWRAVAFHLETCPHCAAEQAALLDLMELAFEGGAVEPPRYPTPDLSFLRQSLPDSPLDKAWRRDALGRLIVEFSAELLRALQTPTLQPAYAVARLKSERSSKVLCQLCLKVENLDVTITVEERQDDPARCTVIVQADVTDQTEWPDVTRPEVVLQRGESKETQRTDAFGAAVFEGVAAADLAQLIFEITPAPVIHHPTRLPGDPLPG